MSNIFELNEETKELLKDADKYIVDFARYIEFDSTKYLEMKFFKDRVNDSLILYEFATIRYILLKNHLEKEYERELAQHEVYAFARNINVKTLDKLFKVVSLDVKLSDVSEIESLKAKIRLLARHNEPKTDEGIKAYDVVRGNRLKALANYNECIESVKLKEDLMGLGIETYIESQIDKINNIETPQKKKVNKNGHNNINKKAD